NAGWALLAFALHAADVIGGHAYRAGLSNDAMTPVCAELSIKNGAAAWLQFCGCDPVAIFRVVAGLGAATITHQGVATRHEQDSLACAEIGDNCTPGIFEPALSGQGAACLSIGWFRSELHGADSNADDGGRNGCNRISFL
ncbi:hypothetical protein, partial [Brevundimonas naejangsanensis]|uniref:hypothetical protein n=1 Tax=Brevundimonas naejangsanensis TaxID=588932 RepID=UPI0034D699F4